MKGKNKVILGSALAIALSASMIAGSTFALFTSESSVNIAVTSAKVSVTAKVDEDTIVKGFDQSLAGENEAFTATYANGTLSLANMAAGDSVSFDIKITNDSTIAVQYRTTLSVQDGIVDGEEKNALFQELEVAFGGATSGKEGNKLLSSWQEFVGDAVEDQLTNVKTVPVTISLPVSSNAQEAGCTLILGVEAIQGNADVNPIVTTAEGLAAAFANPAVESITIAEDIVAEQQLIVPEGHTLTLDLNGKALCSEFGGRGFVNYGNLTINDDGEKTGVVYNNYYKDYGSKDYETTSYLSHAITNFGYLTINGGTFGDNNLNQNDANITTWGAAVMNQEGGYCEINGGNFTCLDNGICSTRYSYAIRNFGDMVINDMNVYGAMNGGVAGDAGLITVNGGKISLTSAKSWHVFTTSKARNGKITIKGGYFTKSGNNYYMVSGFNGMPSWDASESLEDNGYTITGGTFIWNDKEVTF